MSVDPMAFSDPWEHVRLLSDRTRNDAMVALLERHAAGRRVLEVGAGTGLLSLVAARLGAEVVHAVEPTANAEVARLLAKRNGVSHIVRVHEGLIEDLEPEPVDVAFSELLNADPFSEGVLSAMAAARAWCPNGLLAPRRLRVFAALCGQRESADEVASAQAEVRRFARRFELDLAPLQELLDPTASYGFLSRDQAVCSAPLVLHDLQPGIDQDPDDVVDLTFRASHAAGVGAVMVWFEAELDDDLVLHNAPGHGGHWGRWIGSFGQVYPLHEGEELTVSFEVDGGCLEAQVV